MQLCFEAKAQSASGVLTAVHLFNQGVDGFSRFEGVLPQGLSFDHNNACVVEMLGEPHNKGGNNVPVWIEYQDKGLQINFQGHSFEDRSNPITSIALFLPDPTASASGAAGQGGERGGSGEGRGPGGTGLLDTLEQALLNASAKSLIE